MNNLLNRIIAGVSALAILSSSTGTGTFFNALNGDVYAYSDEVKRRRGEYEEGNFSAERDIHDSNYNTNYGLHTNKTATARGDGRTFDIDLESWYVGEDPIDVGLVLDASGSMAWTSTALKPIELSRDSADFRNLFEGKIDGEITHEKVMQFQDDNGGYLPQDIVDKILNPEYTDNSKLGYDYKYYVYEDRASVSEFVPLGYWDGGVDPKKDKGLIGYYPFSNDLKNKAPNSGGASAKLIAHPEEGGTYNTDTQLQIVPKATFFTEKETNSKGELKETEKGIDIRNTAKIGGVLLQSPTTKKFGVSLKFSQPKKATVTTYEKTPILYITDDNIFYKIYRADSNSSQRLKMDTNGSNQFENVNKAFKDSALQPWTFTFDFESDPPKLTMKADNGSLVWKDGSGGQTHTINLPNTLNIDKLKIIIGGADENDDVDMYSEVYVTDVKVLDNNGNPIAEYPFTEEYGLKEKNGKTDACLIKQAHDNGGVFGEEIKAVDVDPVFKDEKYLDLNETSKLGAVSLDAIPDDLSNFTVSMKLYRTNSIKDKKQNIFYLGNKNTTTYYQFFRSLAAGGYLGLSNSNQEDLVKPPVGNDMMYYQGGLASGSDTDEVWYTNTLVFKQDPADPNKVTVTPYINGKPKYQTDSQLNTTINSISVNKADVAFLLGALQSNSGDSKHYVDDVYVFNRSLTADEVDVYFAPFACDTAETAHARSLDADGKVIDIAQISNGTNRLGTNTNIDERRGWYYVNSHSDWEDIDGCLKSGKEYIGLIKDTGLKENDRRDNATLPPSFTDEKQIATVKRGNTGTVKYANNDGKERSIRFYLSNVRNSESTESSPGSSYCLRCFFYTGQASTDSEKRTFCSLVYTNGNYNSPEKDPDVELKYDSLNKALGTFATELHEKSNESRISAVRFSTYNMLKDTSSEENLSKLVMLNWTNDIDNAYNMITPRYNDSGVINSAEHLTGTNEVEQYNYVMTGGTYTWTGLKTFYDQIHNNEKNTTIKNDNKSKYLIVFTDGRDNLIGNESSVKYVHKKEGSGKYRNSIGNFAPKDANGKQRNLENDSQLAKAWADKLKEEGYTIYCVMMATGSISPDLEATKEEYHKAAQFLSTLAGSKDDSVYYTYSLDTGEPDEAGNLTDVVTTSENFDNFVFISNGSLEEDFREVLKRINFALKNYIVQDYIDPRFDLVAHTLDSKNQPTETLLKLGSGGKITDSDGYVHYVGNIIDNPDATGYLYTPDPRKISYHGGYGEDKNQAYIYYDDKKDMYYLRWAVERIGGALKPFDTKAEGDNMFLTESDEGQEGVWYSTITVKAKDDFIGGNAILTNGNEKGMNLVFDPADVKQRMEADPENPKTERDILAELSGTDNSVDRDSEGNMKEGVTLSKGFPRTTVNVRLKEIKTKDLKDLIYVGEIVSPTVMLSELQDGYMTGSYYLEYLARYAYRLYGTSNNTPLIELLNQWLQIDNPDVDVKSFTVPYMYLDNPKYVGNIIDKDEDGNVIKNNSTGTDKNRQDIVGFITYTWERVDENHDDVTDVTADFIVQTPDQIKYDLRLEYTPLQEDYSSIDLRDKHFIPGDKYFKADGEAFIDTTKWSFGSRKEYLRALIDDKSNGKENVYEWDSVYRKTVGIKQLESEPGIYGNAEVSADGLTLNASTTYKKDVVNGALALEMLVKGDDLIGGNIKGNKEYQFDAVRNYTDELLPYGDVLPNPEIFKDIKDKNYKLTFTVDPDTVPAESTIVGSKYYTVWAELSAVQEEGEGGIVYGDQLPIGTYNITADMSGEQFIVKSKSDGNTVFQSILPDKYARNYSYQHFPETVTGASEDAKTDFGVDEYLIYPSDDSEETVKTDYSNKNIVKAAKEGENLKYYFGTDETNRKDIGRRDEYNFAKERLGIIMLSYGEGLLTLGKTVVLAPDDDALNNRWNFKIVLYPAEDETFNEEYNIVWKDDLDNSIASDKEHLSSITFKSKDDNSYYAYISVKNGENVTIQQLPINLPYEIYELREDQTEVYKDTDWSLYTTFVDDESNETNCGTGTINPSADVQFINYFWVEPLPETGGKGRMFVIMLGAVLSAAALMLLFLRKKKIVIVIKF